MTQWPLLIDKKCEALKQAVLALGDQVELALRKSLDALTGQDLGLAREIVEGDPEIDRQRRVLEQEALLVLAAYQPAGQDLRLVGASMEMLPELERIADYAADVGRILLRRDDADLPPAIVEQVAEMGETALTMFRGAMAAYAYTGGDAAGAWTVAAQDDRVDAGQREVLHAVVELNRNDPQSSEPGIALSWIAHLYERVADRATNIAERVVFMATGETPDLD